jgi:hypothetical protein
MAEESRERRFGAPQVLALSLLLLLLVQSAVFIACVPLSDREGSYLLRGVELLRGMRYASADAAAPPAGYGGDTLHSPLTAEVAVAPVLPLAMRPDAALDPRIFERYRWLVRAPFVMVGLLLGASLWYVARRLYGNAGGYVAIGLYCFTPGLVARSSLVGPEILGAWGAFGSIFAAIAVAHTLYAPRNALLWNWKRILLLGTGIGVMVGAQFSLALLLPLSLVLVLWAVPERRAAATLVLVSAAVVGLFFLWLVHGSSFAWLAHSLAGARWISLPRPDFSLAALALLGSFYLREASALALLIVLALVAYLSWRRARFFGNTAPLLAALELVLVAILMPRAAGAVFFFYSVPFFIVFVAGVFADLFENRRTHTLAVAFAYGAILAQAGFSFVGLLQLARVYRPF